MDRPLTDKEESFCQAIARNGRHKKVESYKEAGYSTTMTAAAMGVAADRIYNKAKIALRIDQLMKVANKVAEERFTVSIEKRLRWLEEIVNAGLGEYEDGNGKKRRENLSAAKGAIETLNSMLGTGEDESEKGEEISITFNVSQPVRDVKVTSGK